MNIKQIKDALAWMDLSDRVMKYMKKKTAPKPQPQNETMKLYDEFHVGFYLKPGKLINTIDVTALELSMTEMFKALNYQFRKRGLNNKLHIKVSRTINST